MAIAPKPPPENAQEVRKLLAKYKCPVPYHEVRTRFLGAIVTPERDSSPMPVIKSLWGGELPPFENMEAVNELLDVLVNGLWNALTRHQKRGAPFRLVRLEPTPGRAGLAALSLTRQQEIDGFVEGLFNSKEKIDLPEKASAAMNIIGEIRAMIAGVHTLTTHEMNIGSDKDISITLGHLKSMTEILEREINSVVLACTRARRQMFRDDGFTRKTLH